MHNHEPRGYACPFCALVAGRATERSVPEDVVWRDAETTAFVAPKWWAANEGHVLVVPNRHVENLYDASPEMLAALHVTVRRVALAIRATYGCTGTSTRQHNEPGGGQDVWHLHVHVFPRREGDRLYTDKPVRWTDAAERAPYTVRLRRELSRPPGARSSSP